MKTLTNTQINKIETVVSKFLSKKIEKIMETNGFDFNNMLMINKKFKEEYTEMEYSLVDKTQHMYEMEELEKLTISKIEEAAQYIFNNDFDCQDLIDILEDHEIGEEYLTEEEIKEECLEIIKNGTTENFKEESLENLSEIFFKYLERKNNYEVENKFKKADLKAIFESENFMEVGISIGKESNNDNYYYACDQTTEGIAVPFERYKDVSNWFEEDMCDKIEEKGEEIYYTIGVNNVFFSIRLDNENEYYLYKNEDKYISISEETAKNLMELNRNDFKTFKTFRELFNDNCNINDKEFFEEEDEDDEEEAEIYFEQEKMYNSKSIKKMFKNKVSFLSKDLKICGILLEVDSQIGIENTLNKYIKETYNISNFKLIRVTNLREKENELKK